LEPNQIVLRIDPDPGLRLQLSALGGQSWRIVQPLLGHPPDVGPYPRGSWGPEEAETLLRGHPRWQQPWLPEEG
jgi:glucose-6-phosphate 1-dehydrogenase